MSARDQLGVVEEAARLVCVEQITDYRLAKRKAAEHLGLPARTPLPDNAAVQDAVVEYQRLFGGEAYRALLQRMRAAAVAAMRLFAAYSPRLVGAVVSGAVTPAHRVQLHLFADSAEAVDIDLLNRGIPFEPGARSYRYPDGRDAEVSLLRLDIDGQGVDAAVFVEDDMRRVPINPLDGKPFRRLDQAAAERLSADS